ncbi:MAG: M36 family metallopeptidase, partial [Saprospiraceae bacterium]|nr:M36 family metallopeptidase [Saprospiraceae bacterium]
MTNKLFLFCIAFFLFQFLITHPLISQKKTARDIAFEYLEQHREEWGLSREDVADLSITNQYTDEHNSLTHIYLQQRYSGILIHNALTGIHVTGNGKVGFAGNRFVPGIAGRINTAQPRLSAASCIQYAFDHLGLDTDTPLEVKEKDRDGWILFESGKATRLPIRAQKFYQLMPDSTLRLSWNLSIAPRGSPDFWSLRVDALSGEILDKNNWTLYCQFAEPHHAHQWNCDPQTDQPLQAMAEGGWSFEDDGARYNVFPAPVESPLHGQRAIISDVHDPVASPFGWHDTNGREGPEFTITRGNNVYAFFDRDGNDEPDSVVVDGGPSLNFDFPFQLDTTVAFNSESALTQLFYMNNFMHDFSYRYGFNERSGNFQQNNYSRGGLGGDPVRANAQDGIGRNNATFSTPSDGIAGQMQMFIWDNPSSEIVTVNAPSSIAGQYAARPATFGKSLSDTTVTGNVILVDDGGTAPTLGCTALANGRNVRGKIALVDRGQCFFWEKALNAQNAGAIALIICNNEDELLIPGADA